MRMGWGGSDKFIHYEDMASLKVEQEQKGESEAGTIILGILAAAALVFLIASADSVAICSSPPCESP